jgi:hypothetical protein
VLQGNLTFYLANRIQPRDWEHRKVRVIGWMMCILYQLGVILLARRNPVAPYGTTSAYLFLLVFEIVFPVAFILTLRRFRQEKASAFVALPIVDFLSFVSVLLFLMFGTFFSRGPTVVTSGVLNLGAVVAEMVWTIFASIVFFLYRVGRRQKIVV